MQNLNTGHKVVDAIGQIHFEGNIIPHAWYQTLRLESGKPDVIAMILLSDFIYWHRPTIVRDELTGQIKTAKKKFKADLLQKSYKNLSEQFGFSDKQIREALKRLEEKEVLKRVFRTVDSNIGRLPNTMFIQLNVSGIVNITFPKGKEVFPSKETPIALEDNTITDITTENTTEINNSSSSGVETIISFWDQNGFGFNNINAKTQFLNYLDEGFSEEMLLKALDIASKENKRTLRFLDGIFRNWIRDGIQTVEQVQAAEEEHRNRKNKPTQPKRKEGGAGAGHWQYTDISKLNFDKGWD